jgi:hypothetical protein
LVHDLHDGDSEEVEGIDHFGGRMDGRLGRQPVKGFGQFIQVGVSVTISPPLTPSCGFHPLDRAVAEILNDVDELGGHFSRLRLCDEAGRPAGRGGPNQISRSPLGCREP